MHMWSSAPVDRGRMFDQNLLQSIYEKPHRNTRLNAALIGSSGCGLLTMPFGPIGMVAGATCGGLIGAVFGICVEKRTLRTKVQGAELETKRLKSLLRWAAERLNEDDEVLKLIEMVTLEFKPISDIAEGSSSARKLLKLLDHWIARKSVTRQLWVYMDQLLVRWRDLSRNELLRSIFVFQTLTTMYRYSSRVLDDLEVQFLKRMERLLAHESVMSVMAHTQQHLTVDESRVMESLVYADAQNQVQKSPLKGSTPRSKSPPASRDEGARGGRQDLEEGGSDSDDGVEAELYTTSPSPNGIALSPERTPAREGSRITRMVLKKPFFRSWTDFCDFDDTIKHKMPITLSEFDLLLEKEAEGTEEWDVCLERKDLRVAKIISDDGNIFIRAWATFPGVDLHTCFHLFYNLEERTKWDKTFCKMSVIESGLQGSDIIYCLLKIPTVTSRDFLQYRRVKVLEDGTILIVLRSAETALMPEDSRYIRVENKISGYVMRQVEGGVKMFLMTCSDVKGYIPKWIINFLAPKKPAEWMQALRQGALDYQAAHPGCKAEFMAQMQQFMQDNPWDYEVESMATDLESRPPTRTELSPESPHEVASAALCKEKL